MKDNTLTRRDRMLNQMGMTQWQLVRPESLKGLANLPISEQIRLIIVADEEIDKKQPFLQDILRAMSFTEKNCLYLSFDFAVNLNLGHHVIFWLLGADQDKCQYFLQPFAHCILWQTPTLEILKNTPNAKRDLWRQMQQERKG